MSRYKEGVDFEWVDAKGTGGSAKTRRFFTKAEKEARKAPKAQPSSKGEGKKSAPAMSRAESKPAAKRPKANPARGAGGARPTVGDKPGSLPAARGKAREANPAVVGAMAAGAAAAGIAAARSGRGGRVTGGGSAQTGRNALPKPETRLALPAPNRGGTIIPEAPKPRALPKPEEAPKPKPKARPKSGAKPKAGARGGARAGGPGGGFGQPNVFDKALNPLNLNKGGMVKKKR